MLKYTDITVESDKFFSYEVQDGTVPEAVHLNLGHEWSVLVKRRADGTIEISALKYVNPVVPNAI